MQGIKEWIPSEDKLSYIQSILSVGFDVIDFGSFVSPRAIPQMRDTDFIINNLDLSNSKSKLLAIVANKRGAVQASKYSSISYLGYPFSISETFQMRNTNKSISESLQELKEIKSIGEKFNKELVVYLSMGFGNPYGEPWSFEIVEKWIDKLSEININIISISDTPLVVLCNYNPLSFITFIKKGYFKGLIKIIKDLKIFCPTNYCSWRH